MKIRNGIESKTCLTPKRFTMFSFRDGFPFVAKTCCLTTPEDEEEEEVEEEDFS